MDNLGPIISSPDVLKHIVDVHVHPTDSAIIPQAMEDLAIKICAMSTRKSDQGLVHDLANKYPDKVIPCFGYHPWFTHQISIVPPASKEEHYQRLLLPPNPSAEDLESFSRLLPTLLDPVPLNEIISELRSNLSHFPHAMLGEVGLDRAFRVPYDYDAFPRELTHFHIPIDHQTHILEAQLALAVELKRNVSVHSVKAQQATVDLLTRMSQKHGDLWLRISIDMHSCGLSPQMWKDVEKHHVNVFLSLSMVINSRSSSHRQLIGAASDNRILVESDYNDVQYSASMTINMLRTVAEVKGWAIEEEWVDNLAESEWGVVRKLEANWNAFVRGNHVRPVHISSRDRRLNQGWVSDDESD